MSALALEDGFITSISYPRKRNARRMLSTLGQLTPHRPSTTIVAGESYPQFRDHFVKLGIAGKDKRVPHILRRKDMIEEIRDKFENDRFEFTQHAVDRSIIRHISVQELREAIAEGTIIEDYPDDKYGPSCLVSGFTQAERPLHIQCSYPSRLLIKIITLYEPDPQLWIDFKVRRP